MDEYSSYVGLDVHKDTIAVAVAIAGRSEAVCCFAHNMTTALPD